MSVLSRFVAAFNSTQMLPKEYLEGLKKGAMLKRFSLDWSLECEGKQTSYTPELQKDLSGAFLSGCKALEMYISEEKIYEVAFYNDDGDFSPKQIRGDGNGKDEGYELKVKLFLINEEEKPPALPSYEEFMDNLGKCPATKPLMTLV
jgi:hypothetical protein